jgi:hypothetical protein
MSNITEAQIAEKPITAATDEAINSLTDSRQPRQAVVFHRWKDMLRSDQRNAPGTVAAALSRDNGSAMG